MVKPKWHPADDLTEMQRRVVDYLAYNQGRTTLHKAALKAGYSENRARIEGSELMDNPNTVIWDEAENRLHAQKALIEFLLR